MNINVFPGTSLTILKNGNKINLTMAQGMWSQNPTPITVKKYGWCK